MTCTSEQLKRELETREITQRSMRGFNGAVADSIGRSNEIVTSWGRSDPDALQRRSPFHYVKVAVQTVCRFGGAEQMREYLAHILDGTP